MGVCACKCVAFETIRPVPDHRGDDESSFVPGYLGNQVTYPSLFNLLTPEDPPIFIVGS